MKKPNPALIYQAKKLITIRYPVFGAEIANANIEYSTGLPSKTMATDGKDILIDPDFMNSLTEEERLCVIAHAFMHIKFEHMFRLKTKDGKRRDLEVWNETTDLIVDANLQRDGFKVPLVESDLSKGLKYSAEELYDILLKEKQRQENEDQQKGSSSGDGGQRQDEAGKEGQQRQGEGENQKGQQQQQQQGGDSQQRINAGEGQQQSGADDKQQQGGDDDNQRQGEQQQTGASDSQAQDSEGNSPGQTGDGNGQESSSSDGSQPQAGDGSGSSSSMQKNYRDDHSLWEDASKQREKEERSSKKKSR